MSASKPMRVAGRPGLDAARHRNISRMPVAA